MSSCILISRYVHVHIFINITFSLVSLLATTKASVFFIILRTLSTNILTSSE